MNVYQIVFIFILVALAGLFIYQLITGKNIFSKVTLHKPVLNAIKQLAKAINGVYPGKYVDELCKVIEATVDAVTEAEKLWLLETIAKEERGEYCWRFINDALLKANIQNADKYEDVIRGIIAITCMVLPHYTGITVGEQNA